MKNLLKSKVLLLGLLIRLIVMPFTGHYDIRGINYAVYNLPYKGIMNVYQVACCSKEIDYLVNINFGRDYFIYPPLNYFTLGTFMTILKPFYGPEFATWINGYGNDIRSVITHPHVFRYLFLMKLPYLFFDICMVLLLQQFFVKKSNKERVLAYWWLNPIVIFLPYMWGQFDIIPAFFVMWGILQAARKHPLQAALLMGIGASYKNYPLILMPILAVVLGKNIKEIGKIILIGFAPFVLTTMPFWGNQFFRQTVLFSWQSQKMLDFAWAMSADNSIYPFMVGYTIILLFSLYQLRGQVAKVHIPIVATLLWYYATTNFHQQWFMWVLPFLVLYTVRNRALSYIALFVVGLFFLRLIELQANVTTELFVWLAPAFDDLPKTRTIINMFYDIDRFRGIVNSLIMGTALWISAHIVKENFSIIEGNHE